MDLIIDISASFLSFFALIYKMALTATMIPDRKIKAHPRRSRERPPVYETPLEFSAMKVSSIDRELVVVGDAVVVVVVDVVVVVLSALLALQYGYSWPLYDLTLVFRYVPHDALLVALYTSQENSPALSAIAKVATMVLESIQIFPGSVDAGVTTSDCVEETGRKLGMPAGR